MSANYNIPCISIWIVTWKRGGFFGSRSGIHGVYDNESVARVVAKMNNDRQTGTVYSAERYSVVLTEGIR